MVIVWTPRARREFRSLIAYTEKRSPQGASRIASRILKRVDDLLLFSDQGVDVGRGLQRLEVTKTPYLLFYRVKGDAVVVIGIVHGRRKRRS